MSARRQRDEMDRHVFMQRRDQCARVLLVKAERLGYKDVYGRLTVGITPELQNLHSLVTYPTLTKFFVRELAHRDRNDGSIAKGGEGGERSLDVVRDQLNDNVDVLRKAQISMGADCQSSGYQISHACRLKRGGQSLEAGEFHALSFRSFLAQQMP
jgi:hypothetical protein